MLINAQTPEELRIAIVDGSTLEGYQVEVADRSLTRGNIYRGIVTGIQPGLNAAFVDYGAERNGFLSMQDVLPHAYHHQADDGKRPRIESVLDKGRPVIVQVTKEGEGSKGAALTTNISLAGRYVVFTPHDNMRGISRKLEDEEQRQKLRETVESLRVPDGAGYIIRTNAVGQTKTSLGRDLSAILRLWKKIQAESGKGSGPKPLHADQDIIVRALRDSLDASIDEVLIDDDAALGRVTDYMRSFVPRSKIRIERYTDRAPLFSKYSLDEQIDRIFDRQVALPSGGSIVIDRTEALVAIDVNSGRASRGSQGATALQTNLEAAAEVARQLRLRDIGGLIVVDFIDMRSRKDEIRVEKALRDAMKIDKARSTVGTVSPNGLLEINRQKIQQALQLRTHRACPTCEGTGRIASVEMVGLNLLRRIETRAATRPISGVRVSLHPELADAFQNGRRREIARLEEEFGIDIEVISSNKLHRPEQVIDWFDREPAVEKVPSKSAAAALPPARPAAGGRRAKASQPAAEEKSRNGESHTGSPAAQEMQPPGPQEQVSPKAPRGPEKEPQSAAASQSERRKRSRRRRGRGRNGENHSETATPPATTEPQPAATAAAAVPPAGTEPQETAPAAASEPRKRGRRRRHGQKQQSASSTSQLATGDPAPEPAADPTPQNDAGEGAQRRKSRRRRRRGKGGSDAPPAGAEHPA
jgi:ribonuclease E